MPVKSGRASGLEVRQLRALVALVDSGGMTAAARALGVAQSTVSEALASLERALGTPAVMRRKGTRGVGLTPAGQELLPYARSVLASLDDAQVAVASVIREASASVEIIANESVGTYLLPRALTGVRERWPRTRFAVTIGTCPSVREGVARGSFDLGLIFEWATPRAGEVRASDARARRSASAKPLPACLVLFAAPEHPLFRAAQTGAISLDRLAPYSIFVTDASGDFHDMLRAFFRVDGLPSARLEPMGSVEGVKRSVTTKAAGLGVLPSYAIEDELRKNLVCPVPIRPRLPGVQLEALVTSVRPAHPAASELADALRTALSEGT